MRKLGAVAALCLGLLVPVGGARAQVTIDWVTVGGAGNACDPQSQGCFGAVPYEYRIAKYEVTNAQYAAFLNAVAKTDTNALYNPNMADPNASNFGGITRSGVSGSYMYAAIAGRAQLPVNWVTFYDALRFANWLHNGQPSGVQGPGTTEDGAYTITAAGIAANNIVRNPGATVFVPSEDEWYKAAYYDPSTVTYFDYPAGTDTPTVCSTPTATANRANCGNVVGDLTNVGSYTGSASPNGTFDQGGNVLEWNETIVSGGRGDRGGGFNTTLALLAASTESSDGPENDHTDVGFRVARLPEPPGPGRRGCLDK